MYLHELKYKVGDVLRRTAWGPHCAHLIVISPNNEFRSLGQDLLYARGANGLGPNDIEANDWHLVSKIPDAASIKHGDKFIMQGKAYLRWNGMNLLIEDQKLTMDRNAYSMETPIVQTV